MAITKPTRSMIDTGISDSSNATFLTVDSSENAVFAGNVTVSGTHTITDTVTMNAQNAVVFEGATADAYETTLSIVDPTSSDKTQYLLNQTGYIPLLAAVTTTTITSTPEELNLLDGVSGLVQADLTKLAAVDSTAAEINLLDGLDRGSILYGNASSATTVLGQGSADQVLTSDGTDISWEDASSFNADAAQVFNESGADVDFRIESDDNINMLFVDAGNDRIGIGTASPTGLLHVDGHTSSITSIFEGNGNGDEVKIQLKVKANDASTSTQGLYGAAGSASTDNTITLGNSTTSGIRVDDQGYVGIGVLPETSAANDNSGIFIGGLGGLWGKTTAAAAKHTTLSNNVYDHPSTGQAAIVTDEGAKITLTNGTILLATTPAATTADAAHSWNTGINIAADGIVGIDVVPETDWHSDWKALQVGAGTLSTLATGAQMSLSQNARATTGSSNSAWKYIESQAATQYVHDAGSHYFKRAASGSADAAITWQEQVNIKSNGIFEVIGKDGGETHQFQFHNNGAGDGTSTNCSLSVQGGNTLIQLMAWSSLGCRIGSRGGGWSGTATDVYHTAADATYLVGKSNGTAYLANGSTAVTSDQRLKKNITNMADGQLAKINALTVRNFEWKDTRKPGAQTGLIAQEVESVISDAIEETAFAPDDNDTSRDFDGDVKIVKYGDVQMRLLKAVQELSQDVTNRNQEISDLEQRIHDIEQRLI